MSRRLHGLQSALRDRASSAYVAALLAEDSHAQAALRGKKNAYIEAAEMVAALEKGWRIPWNRRWRNRRAALDGEQ